MTLPGIETLALYAKLAGAAALLTFVGWQYVALNLAEKRAQEADTARAEAVAQAEVLAKSLTRQNAAVAALGKKLAAKQAEAVAARQASDQVAVDAAAQLAAIRAADVPQECSAAVEWLANQLRAGQ